MKNVARYSVHFGLSGCYMPDSHYGAFEATNRKDLAQTIRDAIAFYELPASLFAQARVTKLWNHIKQHGSSVAHFTLYHKNHALTFSGMTEDEFNQYENEGG